MVVPKLSCILLLGALTLGCHCCGSDWIPGKGTFLCHRPGKENKTKYGVLIQSSRYSKANRLGDDCHKKDSCYLQNFEKKIMKDNIFYIYIYIYENFHCPGGY